MGSKGRWEAGGKTRKSKCRSESGRSTKILWLGTSEAGIIVMFSEHLLFRINIDFHIKTEWTVV